VKWRCTWCGREYDENDPPCETCGREEFERVSEETGSAFESESFVWVCENCGREHVKNVGICTRCSQPALRKREPDADLDDELAVPGYLSVGWPYLLGAAAVVVVVVLALAGILPVPGLGGPPAPPEPPGDGEQVAGLDLRTVEDDIRDRFAAERGTERARDDGLNALATYVVRHEVARDHDPDYDGEIPDIREFDPDCGGELSAGVTELDVDPGEYDTEAALAEAITDRLLERNAYHSLVTDDRETEAVAIYVGPGNSVYVSYLVC
jgi:hypothetical protein